MSSSSFPIVDIHTHMYPPSYIDLLSSRTTVPYIHHPPDPSASPRLIILASDDDPAKPKSSRGRPVDTSYTSIESKLSFMATHGITCSVISLANPWLDFLPSSTAAHTAREINDSLNRTCQSHNNSSTSSDQSDSKYKNLKLYAFACLPLSAPTDAIITELHHLQSLPAIKGIIMGTTGLGPGLDDPSLELLYAALASTQILVFLHPHYGLPDTAFGGPNIISKSGHVLPLALGFPLETTIAVTRMYLAGVFDRHPTLRLLLAHSGGTLPFLAGRIESCVAHEREFFTTTDDGITTQTAGPIRPIWDVLSHNIYLDAVVYGEPGLQAAITAAGPQGTDRIMFGTDHPFFPPLGSVDTDNNNKKKWLSVQSNLAAVDGVVGVESEAKRKILGGNAVRVLRLDLS